MRTNRILAAIDRLPEDDAVLLRGMELAAHHGRTLTVVHIVDLPDHSASPALITTFRGQSEIAARNRIEVALLRHGIDPAGTEVIIDTGVPAERLVEICEAINPMLIVIRAHNKAWIVKKLLGSTTEKVVAAGHAPVLIVQPSVTRPYERALMAVDGPDTAPAALTFVAELLPETEVHMVQALAIAPQLEQSMLRVGLTRSDLSVHHDVLARDAEARLAALAEELQPQVTWQVLRGEPALELARASHDPDVDLIALGPNRSSLLQRVFIGSVTRRLLRDAACDVLIGRLPFAGVPDALAQHDPAETQSSNDLPPLAI